MTKSKKKRKKENGFKMWYSLLKTGLKIFFSLDFNYLFFPGRDKNTKRNVMKYSKMFVIPNSM